MSENIKIETYANKLEKLSTEEVKKRIKELFDGASKERKVAIAMKVGELINKEVLNTSVLEIFEEQPAYFFIATTYAIVSQEIGKKGSDAFTKLYNFSKSEHTEESTRELLNEIGYENIDVERYFVRNLVEEKK